MSISKDSTISDDDDVTSDYNISFSGLTSGELVNRLRICFQESDFVAIASRVNEMEEQINEKEQVIQRLKNELEKAESEKKEAQNAVKNLEIRFQSRVSKLEETADELIKEREKVSCKRCAECGKIDVDKQVVDVDESDGEEKPMVSSAAAVVRISGQSPEGSGKIPAKTILIVESDDENASEAANLHQRSCLDALKRKTDAISRDSNNNTDEKANMDEKLNTDDPQLKLQKITHDDSTDNGSASNQNKQGTEHATENIPSKSRSNAFNFDFLDFNFNFSDCSSDYSSSSSSSSDSLDSRMSLSKILKKDKQNWESESDLIKSLMSDDELCLKAVCALYHQGSNDLASRGNTIAEFLIDKDPQGMVRKSVSELLKFDGHAVDDCRNIAIGHSKQLFTLCKSKDPTFQP